MESVLCRNSTFLDGHYVPPTSSNRVRSVSDFSRVKDDDDDDVDWTWAKGPILFVENNEGGVYNDVFEIYKNESFRLTGYVSFKPWEK